MVLSTFNIHRAFSVEDSSDVGAVRRHVNSLCLSCGFSNVLTGKAEIVATELATNLIRHANGGGEILVAPFREMESESDGIELISIDNGPGIADTRLTMTDGISSAGGLGSGLGAIERLSSMFDIFSTVPEGTVVLSRIDSDKYKTKEYKTAFEFGSVVVPTPGFEVSGDCYGVKIDPSDRALVIVIDGIGHGPNAYKSAQEALRVFKESDQSELTSILKLMHENLRKTQGAAVAIANIDSTRGQLTYSGIGNISGRLLTDQKLTGCVSIPGIVGYQLHRSKTFTYPWKEDSVLIMNSDGLTSWSQSGEIFNHSPPLIAGMLYSRYRRGNDDACDVVIRGRKRSTR